MGIRARHGRRDPWIGCLALVRGPQDLVLLVLYTVSGFGFGMRIAQLSTIPADLSSGPHLGAILGAQAGGGLGGAIGPFLGGWLYDVTGSYRLAFMAACIAVAGSAVAGWFAVRPTAGAPDAQRDEPRSAPWEILVSAVQSWLEPASRRRIGSRDDWRAFLQWLGPLSR